MIAKPPVVGICRNPMMGLRPQDMREVAFGMTVAELAPDSEGKPLICYVAGIEGYLLRKDWGYQVGPGDIVIFEVDPPGGKDALRVVLMIVVAVASAYTGGAVGAAYGSAYGAAAAAAVGIAGSLLINALLPPDIAEMANNKKSDVYTTGISGNKARPFDPIPKIMGRHQLFPNYAAQPYGRFTDYGVGSEGQEIGGDVMFHALFAVGVGNHVIERTMIDDTPLSHFRDVLTATYLPPGTPPAEVNPRVVTSPEVAGQSLLTVIYVGGFAACGPRSTTKRVEYDIVMPAGLGRSNDEGVMVDYSVQWRAEVRSVDEFGASISAWSVYHTITKTGATTKPRRWTFVIEFPEAVRPEVRLVRLDIRDDNVVVRNDILWGSMRAFIEGSAPLSPSVAHYELVMRSSDQLSSISQGRLSLIVKALTHTWSAIDGWSEDEVETRNPAWWFAELATSSVWGLGLPDERVDLASIAEYAALADARQDRFDYVMDTATDGWSALQLIARTMRCRAFRRAGVLTLARDQHEALPVTAYTHRNATGMKMVEQHPTGREPDGVIIEYYDYRRWEWMPIECPSPGVESMEDPTRIRLPGITGPMHARREGLYEAASMALRTRTVSATVEMEGVLPAFMSPVRFMPDVGGYGQSGDVAMWDEETLTMTLTEPADFSAGELSISLIRDDGTVTSPVPVTSGVNADQVVLPAAPDFEFDPSDGSRERTKFLLGVLTTTDELVKISAIADGGLNDQGLQLYQITAVVDDDAVHTADNAFLPGVGEIQDPVNPADGGEDDQGFYATPYLSGVSYGFLDPFRQHERTFEFRTDGTLWIKQVWAAVQGGATIYTQQHRQWFLYSPVEESHAALFEVRLASVDTTINSGGCILPTDIGVWYPMTETRSFALILPDMDPAPNTQVIFNGHFVFEVRETATGIIQATGNYAIYADNSTIGS